MWTEMKRIARANWCGKEMDEVEMGFFICWAPFHAQRLVAMYGHLDEHPSKTVYVVYIFLTYISGVLYYLSTTINPLLYHIMSHKFRNAFKVSVDKSKLFHVYGAWGEKEEEEEFDEPFFLYPGKMPAQKGPRWEGMSNPLKKPRETSYPMRRGETTVSCCFAASCRR
ncbi:hypothetical protein RUM44_008997 [Polyplax serrata]|uniref:G-protein coupled receptors family 1 profile domain-containing protein n=1 Tax=Polyplax serrata TaxID=468196 RepID=A0ABR1ARG6_POLSC